MFKNKTNSVKSDRQEVLQDKTKEYIKNGVSLSWLIDRTTYQVYIYTSNGDIHCLDNPQTIAGETVLASFILDLSKIW